MPSAYKLVATRDRDAFLDTIDEEEKISPARLHHPGSSRFSEWTGYRTFILAGVCLIVGAVLGSLSPSAKTHVSLPTLLGELAWDRSLSGLRPDEYVGSEAMAGKLGKEVVILDVDTRPWHFDSANMSQLDYGRLNHYLYARMHGYEYRFLEVKDIQTDRHFTWTKIRGIHEILDQGYKYVVFVDGDVVFHQLKIPVEYMLRHWNVTSDIAVTAGQCQDRQDRYDRTHHNVSLNSGFMIIQKTDITDQLLQDWEDCPTEAKYKGCAHWARNHWHEQSAYSDYVRYDYPGRTREVPCDEVTGSPSHPTIDGKHCDGRLLRHYSAGKEAVKEAVEGAITNLLLPELVNELREMY